MSDVAPRSFFSGHVALRAVIDAVLEGRAGTRIVAGEACRLSVGCYEIFGGDALAPTARELVLRAARPRELVYGNDPAWRRLILSVHGERVFDRPMRDFDPRPLDTGELLRHEATLLADFVFRDFDAGLVRQLDTNLEPHALQVFKATDFLGQGLGVAAVERSGRVACAATPYTRSERDVEVAISTRPEFRGKGLAAATAARLIRQCLIKGLRPCWTASNPVSQRLAMRLGYVPASLCEVLYLS